MRVWWILIFVVGIGIIICAWRYVISKEMERCMRERARARRLTGVKEDVVVMLGCWAGYCSQLPKCTYGSHTCLSIAH